MAFWKDSGKYRAARTFALTSFQRPSMRFIIEKKIRIGLSLIREEIP
jgi:hypothetical protein